MMNLNFNENKIETPCYMVDEALLIKNLEILKEIADKSNCRILLAQKAFSMFYYYKLIAKYLAGTAASGLFEAKLGFEEMAKENHIFSPAYNENEFDEITNICNCIVFNSFEQWNKFKTKVKKHNSCGIRVNPEFSTQGGGIYDPCSKGSRLGVIAKNFDSNNLDGLEGIHFHTLCEQQVEDFVKTLIVFEEKFGKYLYNMKWLNIGGGQHITASSYDTKLLIETIIRLKRKYNIEVYMEPGEAVVLDTGFLVSSIVEIIHGDLDIAILDASAACHMPDILEMPYRAKIVNEGSKYMYRLAGPTCLAGDIIGDYYFDKPLTIGDKIVFCDMSHYTMVKNNTFNGMNLPSILACNQKGEVSLVRKFNYGDFKGRLS